MTGNTLITMGRGCALIAALAAGCVDELPALEGTSSLRVELLEPTDPGTVDTRLPAGDRTVSVRVTAIDTRGEVDVDFTATTALHVQYLGGITPELGETPLARVSLVDGVSPPTPIALESVYGPTVLWVEDSAGEAATFATGTSPTIWFRDPFIADVSTPAVGGIGELEVSPLERKQVAVSTSRHGAVGRLIVTSTYSQGYTVSDVRCANEAGDPPCTTGDFDHLLVFTFGRPAARGGRAIQVGDSVARFTGGVQEFNGLTELGFPQTVLVEEEPRPDRVPAPRVVDADGPADDGGVDWFSNPIEFEKVESFLIEVRNPTVCPLDDDFATYKQWKLNVGKGCGRSSINVITAGVVSFDPAMHVGATIPRIVGALRPVNIGSFNVWIMYPRFAADLQLAP